MNKLLIILAIAAVISLATWAAKSHFSPSAPFKTVSTEEFKSLLSDPDSVLLLDVRTADEFAQAHIDGAVCVCWGDSDFLRQVQEVVPPGIPVAVYCRSGRRSASAASVLAEAGYDVVNLDGGILAWQKDGLPVSAVPSEGNYIEAYDREVGLGEDALKVKVMKINPELTSIKISMFRRPSISNPNLLLAVEAAFTGKLIEDSAHFLPSNICGDYVISGERFSGYDEATTTTGCLCVTPDGATIARTDESLIARAVAAKGYLFHQILLVEDGHDCYIDRQPKPRTDIEYYRALAQMPNSSLCIVQSAQEMNLTEFIGALCAIGVKSAIYLDMGAGWNYGWFRTAPGAEPRLLFPVARKTRYQTNWLIVEPKSKIVRD